MIGNVALDVVIGLVFVYLLYSMYATVLMEIISSFCGLRARNLCYALRRMLMDEMSYTSYLQRKVRRIWTSVIQVTGNSGNLVNQQLYERFFSQPSIKYLCGGGVSNKPSYLTRENFSKALIDSIRIDDDDMTLLGSIEQGLQDGLYKEEIGPETWRHIQSLLDDSNNDLAKFRILLEQWYDDTMERAGGWYKRNVQIFLAIIGFVIAVTFNVNTIAIVKKLSKDKDARDQLVKMATDFTAENENLMRELSTDDPQSDSLNLNRSVTALNARLDSLQHIKQSLEADMNNAQSIVGSAWNISDTLHYNTAAQKIPQDHIQITHMLDKVGKVYLLIHRSIDLDILKSMLPTKLDDNEKISVSPLWYKLRYVFSWKHLGGYFLTMLAISLGAPFWFDLLNKLVKLRTSKAVPTTSDEGPASRNAGSNRATLNRVG